MNHITRVLAAAPTRIVASMDTTVSQSQQGWYRAYLKQLLSLSLSQTYANHASISDGSSDWSSRHGMRTPTPAAQSVRSFVTSSSDIYRRNQREAPHEHGDDELPEYCTASEYRRDPVQPPSYSSSRNSAWQEGSMPPPHSSAHTRSRRSESPAQFPPSRRPEHFYSKGPLLDKNHFIDKWRREQ